LAGAGWQVVHEAPQASTVLFATHVVPRRQKPGVLQVIWHASVPPPPELSHTAMPFADGAGHAVHEAPHEFTLVLATQAPVPAGQRWNPSLHAVVQALATHTACAFGSDGAGHVAHDAAVPHAVVLSLGKQPLTAGHMCVPAPQTAPHAPLTQAWPVAQGVQSVPSSVPQVSDELLLTQTPPQRCQPVSQ
jgi:hypothetical protein